MQKIEQPQQAWPVVPLSPKPNSTSDSTNEKNGQADDRAANHQDLINQRLSTVDMPTLAKIFQAGAADSEGVSHWVQTTQADFFFGGWICVNALVLAFETDARTEDNEGHAAWVVLDSTFNVVFLLEMVLRIQAEKLRWYRDVWNLFDAVLVCVGVVDSWILPATGLQSDMRFITLMRLFRLLRLIRVLRVLRLLRFLKELMLLVQGITSAMRAMVWGLLLLGITIFICALLLTRLVGKACCDSDDMFQNELFAEYFGTFPRTSFTLFQFTMEFQPDICRDTWDYGPWLTFFFLAYTMFTNITLLNTVASVIVENILNIAQQNNEEYKAKKAAEAAEITSKQVSHLFEMADTDGDRMICKSEITNTNPAIEELLEMSGVSVESAINMFNVMDVDCNGKVSREEFQIALFRGAHPLEASDVLRIQCQVDCVKTKMGKRFTETSEQNTLILEALHRLEARQSSLEEKITSIQQPDARELDNMSIRFLPKRRWSTGGAAAAVAPVPGSGALAVATVMKPSEPPPALLMQEADFREETLLV